ncbi:MAG: hypothetical protein KAY64_03820, partial [Anaerolineales bacterium]|nr:hypothetical protein [Anaerolineales bacterium]
DFVLESQTDSRIRAYVSLARGGMDYVFFQNLSDKIEKASGDEKVRLEGIREKLLGFVGDVDKQIEARFKQAQDFVESLLAQDDIEKVTQENIDNFTQDSVEVVNQLLRQASEKNDYARMGKLQKMVQVLQAASAPPPEIAFIEQLLQAPDEAAVDAMLVQNDAMVNQQFVDALSGLVAQMDSQGAENLEAKAMSEKLTEIYRVALKRVMKKNMG